MVVEAHRIIRATREHVFAFVAHPEHLPRYGAPLWLAADLEDRRGAEPLITLRGYFAGLPVEAVIRGASRAPHSVDVAQVRGTLRGFSQRFTIESSDDGTLLTCRVEADPGIPMLSDEAAKHFLTQYVERMLDRLRLAAERRAPSRRPARPSAKDAVAAAADADESAPDDAAIAAEAAAGPGEQAEGPMSEPAGSPERTEASPPAPRPSHRPMPPRGPRPPRSPRVARQAGRGGARTGGVPRAPEAGTDARAALPPEQAGATEVTSPGQGRRRRRRRRRRGPAGNSAARGEAGGSPPPAGDGQTPAT